MMADNTFHREDKRTYTVDDIMGILDIGRNTAYTLIKKKMFRSMKIGTQIRISKASFDNWLDNG
jgi:excisionase family DNA binding protein